MTKPQADKILAPNSGASSTEITIAKVWIEGYNAGVEVTQERKNTGGVYGEPQ